MKKTPDSEITFHSILKKVCIKNFLLRKKLNFLLEQTCWGTISSLHNWKKKVHVLLDKRQDIYNINITKIDQSLF